MRTLGFTGTRSFTPTDLQHVDPAMWHWFELFDTFATGACVGFDTAIGQELVKRLPRRRHVVIVPADRSRVSYWWEAREFKPYASSITVIPMPPGTSYRDRNKVIVARSDALFYATAAPELDGSQRRSGAWMTVRLARVKGLQMAGVVLNPYKTT